jgi:hypothetical protein
MNLKKWIKKHGFKMFYSYENFKKLAFRFRKSNLLNKILVLKQKKF